MLSFIKETTSEKEHTFDSQKLVTITDCHMPTRHTHSLSVLLLFELIELLLLEGSWLAESELYRVCGQLGVSVSHSAESVLDGGLIKGIKIDSFSALSVDRNTSLAASDAAWLNNVVKKSVMDCLESSGTGSLLRSVVNS